MHTEYEYLLEPLNETGSAFVVRKICGPKIYQEYTVSINNKGYLNCNCPGFMGHKYCKHITMQPSDFMIELCNYVDSTYHTRIKHNIRSAQTKDH